MYITRKRLILILLCVVLGAVAAYAETVYVRSVYAEIEEVPVLFAKGDIPVNSGFTGSNVEYRGFPKNMMSDSMVTDVSKIKDMVASRDIPAGRPIYEDDLSVRRVPVAAGDMRRVTFRTNLENSLAGRIYAGDYVDIGFVAKGGSEAEMVFEAVQVAYVTDKRGAELGDTRNLKKNMYDTGGDIPAAVTVIMSPEDAVALKRYEAIGDLFIMGRGLE